MNMLYVVLNEPPSKMLHDIFLTVQGRNINAGISDYGVGVFLTRENKYLI